MGAEAMSVDGQRGTTIDEEPVSVLLVDDDALVLRALCRLLVAGGLRVTTVTRAREALARLAAEPFDLVLTDVSMPEMDGIELLRRIRAAANDVPVVLMSGDPRIEDTVRQLRLDATAWLPKPIEGTEVRRCVARCVRRARAAPA
jgi:CheY-like chemotaxis protein